LRQRALGRALTRWQVGSPLEGIAEYERLHALPNNYVNVNVSTRGPAGAFQTMERGELTMDRFYDVFQRELEDPAQMDTYMRAVKWKGARPAPVKVNTRELMARMLGKTAAVDPDFAHCLVILRGSGLKTAALTNNFAPMASEDSGRRALEVIGPLFDVIVESAVEGVRKPSAEAYQLVCERLGVGPSECAFFDDIGVNCKAAAALGIAAVRVQLRAKRDALAQMERLILQRNGLSRSLVPPAASADPQTLFWACGGTTGEERLVGDAFGDASKPAVILLHGGGQTRHAWGATAKTLAESGFFAVAMDQKGHGDSYWDPEANYQSPHYASDLDRLVDAMGVSRPVLIGASLGGLASMGSNVGQTSARAMVLVDVAPRLEVEGVHRVMEFMRQGAREGFATLEDVAKAVASYQPHRPARPSTPEALDGLKKNLRFDAAKQRWMWHWDPEFLSSHKPSKTALGYQEWALTQCARNVTCPVLLVRGKQTDMVSPEGAQALKAAVPHAQLVDVSGAAHMVAGDSNDVFTTELLRFLKALDGASAAKL